MLRAGWIPRLWVGLCLAGFASGVANAADPVVGSAAAQSLALVAKADGSYIRGIVTNELTGNPIAGVKVELATALKALDNTVTDAQGRYSFPTAARPNSTTEGNRYDLAFAISEFKLGTLDGVVASTANANIALRPLGVTAPGQPIARSGPRSVYIEWPANPEYNLKGYNVYRQQVAPPPERVDCNNYIPQPIGELVKLNGTAGNVYSSLITGTEYVDTTVQKGLYYIYKIQAISGGDRPSDLSRSPFSCPPAKGDFLAIFFPDVYVQSTGLFLWELVPGQSPFVRIPVSSRCAYDIVTSGMQIKAELPATLINPDGYVIAATGVTAAMAGALETNLVASPNPDVLDLLIANASLNAQNLYGSGDLFNVYVKTKVVPQDTCGPLHLLDEEIVGPQNGVRVYDNSVPTPLKVDVELKDGVLCKGGGCLHGDVNLDGVVDMDDASDILKIWVKKIPAPQICWPDSGDINRDGYADAADSTLIQRWLAGMSINPTAAKEDLALTSFAVAGAEKVAANPLVAVGLAVGDPGETVTVPVTMTGAAPTAGFEMTIAFPAGDEGLTYVQGSATLGAALAGYDIAENSGETEENSANGWVSIAVSGAESQGKAGTIDLVTLQFTIGANATQAMPLVLVSFNQFDQYGHTPRQTDPLVPTKDDGQVILKDDTIEVPNVLGLTLANATARIEAEGLVVGNVTHVYGNAAAGDVEAQTPAAGTQVAPGSAVDLVISDGPAQPPVADFGGYPRSGSAPLAVQFTDYSDYRGRTPQSWAWTFGDGGTSAQQNPSRTYQSPGTYTVSLTVTTDAGSDTETKTGYVTVTEAPQSPLVDFTGVPQWGVAPLTVNFTDATLTYGRTVLSRSWTFGDGGTSTQQNPSRTYQSPGKYSVSLTVTTDAGSDTVTKANYITVSGTGEGISMWIPDRSATAGRNVVIPLNMSAPGGVVLKGVQIEFYYDAAILDPATVQVQPTALTGRMSFAATVGTPGKVIVNVMGATGEIRGVGHLFDVEGRVRTNAVADACGEMGFDAVYLYDQNVSPLPVDFTDTGNLCVDDDCMVGDLNGNGAVEIGDALYALMIAVKKRDMDACSLKAGDLNGDNVIDSADAVMLQRMAAGMSINPRAVAKAGEADEMLLSVILEGQDYVMVSLENGAAPVGTNVDVPIWIDNPGGLSGFDVWISYPPELTPLEKFPGTVLSGGQIDYKAGDGMVNVSMGRKEGVAPMKAGPGTLATVRFYVNAMPAGGKAEVRIEKCALKGQYGDSFSWYTAVQKVNATIAVREGEGGDDNGCFGGTLDAAPPMTPSSGVGGILPLALLPVAIAAASRLRAFNPRRIRKS